MMNSTNEIVDQIRQFLSNWQVLTDIEDRYVYSFEKIYSKAAYPLPDIVVRINRPEDSIKFSEWIKDQDLTLITRNLRGSWTENDHKKVTILLDDIVRPEMSRISEYPKNFRYLL